MGCDLRGYCCALRSNRSSFVRAQPAAERHKLRMSGGKDGLRMSGETSNGLGIGGWVRIAADLSWKRA